MQKSSAEASEWNIFTKGAFRFAFIYIILFIILLDWSVNPVLPYLFYEGGLAEFLDAVIGWVARNIFSIQEVIIAPYDGQHNDRTYVYLLYFIMLSSAALGTVVWSLLDRKRRNYETLYYWLTTLVRYYLALTLFIFALEKFFKLQFPDLGLYALTQPVGDMSPMSLAWAFFGYSYGYNVFMGIAESAALFLLFRRTMTFGAILTTITLANVIAVNFNYDVHAKMYPVSLLLMTLFLLAPHANRLFRFFFTSQPTSLPVLRAPVLTKPWMNYTKIGIKTLLILYIIVFSIKDYTGYYQRRQDRYRNKAGISGLYNVESYVVNEDTLAVGDSLRWRQIILGEARERVRLKGDSIAFLDVYTDSKEMFVYGDRYALARGEQELINEYGLNEDAYPKIDSVLLAKSIRSRFQFEKKNTVTLLLKGKVNSDSVFILARKLPVQASDFRLTKRRFHWLTETAYTY